MLQQDLSHVNSTDENLNFVDFTPPIYVRDPTGPVKTKGRPKIPTRIRSALDLAEQNRKKRPCGSCDEKDHNSIDCPKRKMQRRDDIWWLLIFYLMLNFYTLIKLLSLYALLETLIQIWLATYNTLLYLTKLLFSCFLLSFIYLNIEYNGLWFIFVICWCFVSIFPFFFKFLYKIYINLVGSPPLYFCSSTVGSRALAPLHHNWFDFCRGAQGFCWPFAFVMKRSQHGSPRWSKGCIKDQKCYTNGPVHEAPPPPFTVARRTRPWVRRCSTTHERHCFI